GDDGKKAVAVDCHLAWGKPVEVRPVQEFKAGRQQRVDSSVQGRLFKAVYNHKWGLLPKQPYPNHDGPNGQAAPAAPINFPDAPAAASITTGSPGRREQWFDGVCFSASAQRDSPGQQSLLG